jgi:ParB family chromosome partitioning protein
MALVENIQREDLNPMEAAAGYQRLVDEFQLTQESIAVQVGKDRATVANYLRLLKLPEEVRNNVSSGALSMGHARAIVALTSDGEQKRIARDVVSRGLSVRETEALVKKAIATQPGTPAPPMAPKTDVHTRAAEEQLRMRSERRLRSAEGKGRRNHDRVHERERTSAALRIPDGEKMTTQQRRRLTEMVSCAG